MVDKMMVSTEPDPVRVTAQAFSAKYKSKKECFNLLTVKCRAYLSSYETVTVYCKCSLLS